MSNLLPNDSSASWEFATRYKFIQEKHLTASTGLNTTVLEEIVGDLLLKLSSSKQKVYLKTHYRNLLTFPASVIKLCPRFFKSLYNCCMFDHCSSNICWQSGGVPDLRKLSFKESSCLANCTAFSWNSRYCADKSIRPSSACFKWSHKLCKAST